MRDLNLHRRVINLLKRKAKELVFYILTQAMQNKDNKLMGVRQPKLKRVVESKNQLAFRKEFDNLKIVVYTSINEKECQFTQTGRVWVHVIGPHRTKGTDTVYSTYFRRTEGRDLIDEILWEMEFLSDRLVNRPVGKDGKRMLLVEKPHSVYNWVSQTDENETISLYTNMETLRPEVKKFALEQRRKKQYYESRRDKLGVKQRERDIRHTARVTQGEKALDRVPG